MLRALFNTLNDIDEPVSKHIQKDTVSSSDACALFDSLLEQFPELQHYLGFSLSTEHSTIVLSSVFESTVIKKCNGQSLNRDEQLFIDRFEEIVEIQPSKLSFAERTLLATRAKTDSMSNLEWVPFTSIIVERLFSIVRYIFND